MAPPDDIERDQVCVVGVGALGSVVAGRLASAGFDVLVHDADEERARTVASEIGASAALTLRQIAEVSVVVLLLPDSNAVSTVLAGDDGLLSTIAAGALIIDMGSSDPRRTVRFAEQAAAAGIDYADAPVSGGIRRAQTGELTVMFGGEQAQLERARPLLDAIGTTVIHVGEVGSAHAMKALNNLLSALNLAGSLEVMEVGQRFGIDPQTMLDTLNASTGQSNVTLTKIDRVLDGSLDSGFALQLMLKDITTALAIARETDSATPLGDVCIELWRSAARALPPDADQLAISSVLWSAGPQAE